MEMKNSELKAR